MRSQWSSAGRRPRWHAWRWVTCYTGEVTSPVPADDLPLRGRPGPPGAPRTPRRLPADLGPEERELYDRIAAGPRRAQAVVPLVDEHERLLGPFGLVLDSPRIGTAVQAVGAALRFDPDLAPLLRELAILTVAVHRRSDFEWRAHEAAAVAAGATVPQLQAVLDDAPVDGVDASTAAGLALVRAALVDGDVDDALFDAAVRELGRPTTSALVWLVGYYAMLATALRVLRPE